MRDAAVPGDDQQIVIREDVAENVCVRKDCPEHQRPSDDAASARGTPCEHVLPAEQRFADQRSGDSVSDGVHAGSLQDRCEALHFSVRK